VGRLVEARRAWLAAARLADNAARRKKDEAEAERLAAVLARTPYLGLTLVGETTTVRVVVRGGPAGVAGVRAGDRIDRIGKETVDSPAAVREAMKRYKVGDLMQVTLTRDDEEVKAVIKVGGTPTE
jgi:predicted metalloprotease with PDZ domain